MSTAIEWTDETWNPVVGCSRVSAGCRNCYAFQLHDMRQKAKQAGKALPRQYDFPFTMIQLFEDRLRKPMSWRKPKRIFVNSGSDLFHEKVPFEFIGQVWEAMGAASHHTFQVLTKRPQRMLEYFEWCKGAMKRAGLDEWWKGINVLPNVWLGVSVEDQRAADERIPLLLQTPAAVRFLSCEPLLGPVDLGLNTATCSCCDRWASRWIRLPKRVYADFVPGFAEPGIYRAESNPHGALSVRMADGRPLGIRPAEMDILPGLDWVICGGESGAGARPMHPDWARSLRDQCQAAGVPFFFKQWGEWLPIDMPWSQESPKKPAAGERWLNRAGGMGFHGEEVWRVRKVGKKAAGRLLDGREWNEFPKGVAHV